MNSVNYACDVVEPAPTKLSFLINLSMLASAGIQKSSNDEGRRYHNRSIASRTYLKRPCPSQKNSLQ